MRVLIATKELQGQRANDFSHATEGELVMFGTECDRESVDGRCGCKRSMSGLESHLATTTMKVVEMDLTPEAFEAKVKASLVAGGWANGPDGEAFVTDAAKDEAKELLRLASVFEVGAVLERRGRKVGTRYPKLRKAS